MIAASLPDEPPEDRVAAMSAAMLALGERIASELGRGELEQVIIKGSEGYALLQGAGRKLRADTSRRLGLQAGLALPGHARCPVATCADCWHRRRDGRMERRVNPKYIFCTGGVVSSVGKGLTVASIGRILKARGFKVAIQKLDPYLNVDPGTMNPYQHGEVFVTSDGAETDLDLGHYERFVDEPVSRLSNVTAGQVYLTVIEKERKGDYLGGTIQVVPHITNEIKRRIKLLGQSENADVVIVEVGGTAGDIESLPFLEALRQLRTEFPRRDTINVHVTFLPHIGATGELKTKPTQHSVRELRGIGIQPNVIIARTDHPVNQDIVNKIALFCDVDDNAVIPLETTDSIYAVPLMLESSGLGDFICERFRLEGQEPDLHEWRAIVSRCRKATESLRIGIVGKYVELHDAYMSVKESITHAAIQRRQNVEVRWIHSGELEKGKGIDQLRELDGIVVPGGFGYRGHRGQDPRRRIRPRQQNALFGFVPGHAGHVHRIRPQRPGFARRQQL